MMDYNIPYDNVAYTNASFMVMLFDLLLRRYENCKSLDELNKLQSEGRTFNVLPKIELKDLSRFDESNCCIHLPTQHKEETNNE